MPSTQENPFKHPSNKNKNIQRNPPHKNNQKFPHRLTHPNSNFHPMKYGSFTWCVPKYPTLNWNGNFNIIFIRMQLSIPLNHSRHTRHRCRMNIPFHAHKQCLLYVHLNIHTHNTRNLLQIPTNKKTCLNHWIHSFHDFHNNCIPGLCASMRTNIFLGSYCYYQHFLSHPLHRKITSWMNMRKLLRLTTHPYPIFLPTFHHPNNYNNSSYCSHSNATRNWVI